MKSIAFLNWACLILNLYMAAVTFQEQPQRACGFMFLAGMCFTAVISEAYDRAAQGGSEEKHSDDRE